MSWRSTAFEAFTWSRWVEAHYELFWIGYLALIWTVPDVVLLVDPYALSIVPLIAVIEIGFRFYEVVVESFAGLLVSGVRALGLYTFWAVFLLPFVLLGLYVIWVTGSAFTTAMYLLIVGRTIVARFQEGQEMGARIALRVTEAAMGGFTFLACMVFVSVPWPELGLAGRDLAVTGEGLLVDHPHREVPTAIIAFAMLWAVKTFLGAPIRRFLDG